MKRNVRFIAALICLILLATTLSAAKPVQAADQIGFEFLDRLIVLMVKAVAPGGGSVEPSQELVLLAKELKAAHEAKRVDDLFAVKYARLLSAVRQGVLRDPELLYWPMYRYTMADFIEERTGRPPDWAKLHFVVNDHGGSGVGLAVLSDAVLSEVVSLHIHLENLAKRPEILQLYMGKAQKAMETGK